MKNSTILIIAGAVIAGLYLAFKSGILSSTGLTVNARTGVPSGNIVVPQPSQNYSGYLAASTAPGVAGALNGVLSGLGGAIGAWMAPAAPAPAVAQGASPTSPSLAAQPVGPQLPTTNAQLMAQGANSPAGGSFVGPQLPPEVAYDATSASAFDYSGLAADNAYDPSASLMEA